MKYGVVGAIALAVLVAAMWDGSKSKKKTQETGEIASVSSDNQVTGDVVAAPKPPEPSSTAQLPASAPVAQADELMKYQVHRGDTLRSIAKLWIGDEKLAQELYDANKTRIPDARKLNANLTLVFPRSKFVKPVGTAGSSGAGAATIPAGMKKTEVEATSVPAGEKKYVVKEGDTLYSIAKRELGKGSRWEEIAKLNDIDGSMVKKGQTLVMPAK